MVKTKCYSVKYYDNIFGRNVTLWKMSKTESMKQIRKMKKQNSVSIHNSKIIDGKPFEQFKKMKIVKVC